MKKLMQIIQPKIDALKRYKFYSLMIFATFFVLHFVFLILFCAQAQSISDNIKVDTDTNTNPISITSDKNFVNITLSFKVSTKEFGEKNEVISLDSLKKDVKTDIELKLLKNDNITIENVECHKINTSIKNIFFVAEIIVIVLTIITGVITLFLFNDNWNMELNYEQLKKQKNKQK